MTADPLSAAQRRSIEMWARRNQDTPPGRIIAVLMAEIDRLKAPRRPAPPEGCPLTERQLSVLTTVAAGASRAEVGRWLDITENSVKSHLKMVYKVLRVSSTAQAVAMAVRYGWIPDEDLNLPDPAGLEPARLIKERQEYYDRAAALRAHPREWKVVADYTTSGSAKQSAYRLRVGKFKAFRPVGWYEAKAFTENGKHFVRARYLGDPSSSARRATS
ncbi:LuxR C-terminal-related transcriptional regulator [Streptomyces brasiliscabiei]|uniref:LuxR C-terminal-related transcriptional regulator n=1 Tax=Streptomyces brasiliscabiei TaxID=2736302 RepID=A0ABU8GA14_9ACTN